MMSSRRRSSRSLKRTTPTSFPGFHSAILNLLFHIYRRLEISDVVHACFGTHGQAVAGFFQQLLPFLNQVPQLQLGLGEGIGGTGSGQMLTPGRPYGDRQWAICLFDDLIEYGSEESKKYSELFLPAMMAALDDAHPAVRQAAAYGFGVLGLKGDAAFAPACAAALPALGRVIEAAGSRDSTESNEATENAIAAVAKILRGNAGSVPDVAPYISSFLHWLPVWEDKEEIGHTYAYFADLIESYCSHPSLPSNELTRRVPGTIPSSWAPTTPTSPRSCSSSARPSRRRPSTTTPPPSPPASPTSCA